MWLVKADQFRKCARRITFGALVCSGLGSVCFAQEPPWGAARAGALATTAGCDAISARNLYSDSSIGGGTQNTGTITNTGVSPDGNFGGNVPLYGTDLNGNVPLYSTPDLGGNFPLYTNPTPGMNTPLYGNPSVGNYNGTNGSGRTSASGIATPIRCKGGIPVGEWVIYPTFRTSTLYSDNLFLAPTAPTKVVGFGATPSLAAEWTNGIHTTTLFGTIDTELYPTDNAINTLDSQLTATQKYSPLPDLTFTAQGNYSHQTIQSALTNSIPGAISTPPATPTLLSDGNIELPNGNIVAPNGQVIGHAGQALALSGATLVNPLDVYTATGSVNKIFNGAFVNLSAALAENNYQSLQGTGPTAFTSFKTATYSESSSFALGPLFYVFSNGSFSQRTENSTIDPDSNAYRIVGGIGTRQFGLFRVSTYFGHQGSDVEGSGTAGGNVYGGRVSYFPTYAWAITAAVDQTNNYSSQTAVSTQALTLPTNTPVQIALSSSARTTTPSLQSTYQISPQLTLLGSLSYSHVAFVNSSEVTDAWLAALAISYEMWRNMTIAASYQFSNLLSNVPGTSATRNLISLSAEYRF
jgi:Putative beta-barrel porin 2